MSWPRSSGALIEEQERLASLRPSPWEAADEAAVGGCFVCFPRGLDGTGSRGDPAWVAGVVLCRGQPLLQATLHGRAGAPYVPGMLAAREGPALEAAVRALPRAPDVLLVNAAGRDHPRSAGLALHLGAVLDLPTVGVTHRPFVARGDWPASERGARSPVTLRGQVVGHWVRTVPDRRPVVAHAAWRTGPAVAADVVERTARRRTPEPLRAARRAARSARAVDTGNGGDARDTGGTAG